MGAACVFVRLSGKSLRLGLEAWHVSRHHEVETQTDESYILAYADVC